MSIRAVAFHPQIGLSLKKTLRLVVLCVQGIPFPRYSLLLCIQVIRKKIVHVLSWSRLENMKRDSSSTRIFDFSHSLFLFIYGARRVFAFILVFTFETRIVEERTRNTLLHHRLVLMRKSPKDNPLVGWLFWQKIWFQQKQESLSVVILFQCD